MADLHPLLIDKRVVERNLAKGAVDPERYEQYLADLPDRADNGQVVELEPPERAGEEGGAPPE